MNPLSYFRGLKLKLTIILLIGSIAQLAMYQITIRTNAELKETIDNISKERLPKTAMFGDATTELARFTSLSFEAVSAEGDQAQRAQLITEIEQSFQKYQTLILDLKKFKLSEKTQSLLSGVLGQLKEADPKVSEFVKLLKSNSREYDSQAKKQFSQNITPHLMTITKMFLELRKRQEDKNLENTIEAKAKSISADHMALSVLVLSLLFFWIMGQTFAFFIVKKLRIVNLNVENSSREVSTASENLSLSSQDLSRSSQEQAAALEEASASLQEIAGMVESTVKNTEDSLSFAKEVKNLSEETNQTIHSLSDSMKEIQAANQKVEALSRLIEEIGEKTELIDEIVFQTKLLSFNASVEAERAGEAGRGFAVVAQEVGNLAAMSGKSAIEIANIVKTAMKQSREVSEDNRGRVEKGAELCQASVQKMKGVTSSTEKILGSCELVLRASQEQSTGIRQVSTAVESLNRATQANAGNAESSASASSALADLSTSLKSHVSNLHFIIDGQSQHIAIQTPQQNLVIVKSKAPAVKQELKKPIAKPVEKSEQKASVQKKVSGSDTSGWDNL